MDASWDWACAERRRSIYDWVPDLEVRRGFGGDLDVENGEREDFATHPLPQAASARRLCPPPLPAASASARAAASLPVP
jgi:hypothetical protein